MIGIDGNHVVRTSGVARFIDGVFYAITPSIYSGGAYMIVKMDAKADVVGENEVRGGYDFRLKGITYGSFKQMQKYLDRLEAENATAKQAA